MKKLFTLLLSTFAVIGLSACGGEKFDDTVLAAGEGVSYHLVGGGEAKKHDLAEWGAIEANKMEATSVAEVAKFSKGLAKTLAGKSLQHLYVGTLEVLEQYKAGWEAMYVKDGEEVKVDGYATVKVIEGAYNAEEQTYSHTHWIPNPADTDCCHLEALTDNLFIPPYQKTADEHGLSWNSNPVIMSGEGVYKVVIAKYTVQSTEAVCGYGMGVVLSK